MAGGSDKIYNALKREVESSGLKDVKVDFTGCHGFCEKGPLVVVEPEGLFYAGVKVDDVPSIARTFLPDGEAITEGPLYEDPKTGTSVTHYKNIDFYRDLF